MYQYYLQDGDKFWQRFYRHWYVEHINFAFVFPKITGGQLSPLKLQIVSTLYSFTSPRIENLKFSYFNTYEQSCVGKIFLD